MDSIDKFAPDPDSEGPNRQLANPAKFMHETGLLFLINKLILHRHGIAVYYGENEEGHPEGGLGVSVTTNEEPFDFDAIREIKAQKRLDEFMRDPQKYIGEAK